VSDELAQREAEVLPAGFTDDYYVDPLNLGYMKELWII
jgi:hypothetical protein